MKHRMVLAVEDSREDAELMRWALQRAGYDGGFQQICCVDDAIAAMHPVQSAGARPSLVLLDLDLPDGTGKDVLLAMRAHPDSLTPPVIVVTTSTNPRDVEDCYRLGAAGYLTKPLDRMQFADQVRTLVDYWLRTVRLP